MKILCVCIGGCVRSVALKRELNNSYGHDALAAGVQQNSDDTVRMLCEWADAILPVEPRTLHRDSSAAINSSDAWQARWESSSIWDSKFASKVRVLDIGADIWGSAEHPDLQLLIRHVLAVEGRS